MKIKESFQSRIFDAFNIIVLLLFTLSVIMPFINAIAVSLSSANAIMNAQVKLWPVGFNLDNYRYVAMNPTFWISFRNTLFVVFFGTSINLLITVVTAYPLSKTYLSGRKVFMLILIFIMIFQAPLIPMYLTVKTLGLHNTLWALILPGSLNVFNTLLCITFFKSLPQELFEAARIDGMSEYGILFKIAIPLSKPIMATLLIFFSVAHWNNYQAALYYITNVNLRPLQLYLWSLVAQTNTTEIGADIRAAEQIISPEGLKMATVLTATIPILLVYPFLQKHFVKGILIGSVKG